MVRSGNEDNYLMVPDQALFIVADGMGGHAAGEVASEMAVRIIAQELGDIRDLDEVTASDRIRKAIREANSAIFDRTLTEHDKRGMGTTATTLGPSGCVSVLNRHANGSKTGIGVWGSWSRGSPLRSSIPEVT